MEEKAQPCSRKEQIYNTFSALDQDDDDQPPDEGRLASQRMLTNSGPALIASRLPKQPPHAFGALAGASAPRRISEMRQGRPLPGRTLSEPSPKLAPSLSAETHSVSPGSPQQVASPPVRSFYGDTMSSAKREPMRLKRSLDQLKQIPRALSKGKKDSKIKLVPENRRVFKDLVFFFFPNNDINLARRRRIAKAIEYGASWVVEWCDDITHVIVDRDLQFEHLTTHLKIDALPQHIVVVNENYPADCITYLDTIDHKQPQYRIQGYESSDAHSVGAQSSNPISASKGVAVAQSTIPPKSKESGAAHTQHAPSAQDNQGPKQKESAEESAISEVYADALEDIIARAKSADYLSLKPLDLDDEDSPPQTSDIEDSDTEDERPKKVAKTSVDQHAGSSEQFQCMKKNDGKTKDTNANARTIEVLTQMGDYYEKIKDEWRSRAYRKAISVLRKQDHKITTKEEAIQLPCIGSRIAAKIEEIVWTNRLRRLDNARLEPGDEALQTFLKIYGVGLSKASKWVMAGLRTLDDLKSHKIPLTPAQQVGLTHYSDFNTRIPRDEVTQHAAVVRAALQAIDPACTATVGGSYRRGALDSGDIDVLISHPTADLTRLQQIVFDVLVPALTASGFLKVALAAHRSGSRANNTVDHGTKWHGVSALPATNHEQGKKGDGIWRRIDLLLVPEPQLGAALIYFTGNDIFNRSIRLLASRKGMRLNQRGLYKDVLRGRGREKITEGELVEGRSEERIFDVLGVSWRPPEHRIC